MPIDHELGEFYDDGAWFDAPKPKAFDPFDEGPPSRGWLLLSQCWPPVVELSRAAISIQPQCESPIELMFGAELVYQAGKEFIIKPQYGWRRYRMDFAVCDPLGNVLAFVECDGKEFHSTPEQLANDARKNEAAAIAGIPLYRFTGSEIHRFASSCAGQVLADLR